MLIAVMGCSPRVPDGLSGGAQVTAPPELQVESAPGLEAAAEGVRRAERSRLAAAMRLTGLEDPGPPIHVVLVAEDSATAQATPAWVAGYADSDADLIVLFPQRSPSYPDASVAELVGHEVAHVLIDRAAGGRPLPRWFHEGLAMVAGGAWGLDDRSRVTLALVLGGPESLAGIDEAFASREAGRVGGAYALSGAFVRDLLARHGRDAAADVLAAVAGGEDFEDAFAAGTGVTLARAEELFWRRSDRWYRWVPVITSSLTLWVGIVMLAFWAYRRRRARAEAIQDRWEGEDSCGPPHRGGEGRPGPGGPKLPYS